MLYDTLGSVGTKGLALNRENIRTPRVSSTWSRYIVPAATIVMALLAMVAQYLDRQFSGDISRLSRSALDAQISELTDRTDSCERFVDSIRQKLAALGTAPMTPDAISAGVIELRGSVAVVENRIGTLESSLAADPVRALSVPMLRRDVDDLKDIYKRDVDAIRSELGRNATQSNWVLGLIGASVLTLAVNTFLNARRERARPE